MTGGILRQAIRQWIAEHGEGSQGKIYNIYSHDIARLAGELLTRITVSVK